MAESKNRPPSSDKPGPKAANAINTLEWAFAIALTVWIAALHIVYWRHAGALWRDEANTAYICALPSFSEIVAHLPFDSFPLAWFIVLRGWSLLGFGSDLALRFLGMAMGFLIVAVLWRNAKRLNYNIPLFSLALMAASPMMIRWGDSLRAYGMGVVTALLVYGMVWKFLFAPTKRNALIAAALAIVAVQTLYYNSVLLFTICIAAAFVAAWNHWWKRAFVILALGAPAAASLLLYRGTMKHLDEFSQLVRTPSFDFALFWAKLADALNISGPFTIWVWLGLFCSAVVALLFVPHPTITSAGKRDLWLFSFATLFVGSLSYYIFLKALSYPTNPWYYLALITIVGVSFDGIFSCLIADQRFRIVRLIILVAFSIAAIPETWRFVQLRQSNMDLLAAEIEAHAQPHDLILHSPWYHGVSFQRYFHSATPQVTIPPIHEFHVHRYDLVREQMKLQPDTALEPVLNKIADTLKSGQSVWGVGYLSFPEKSEPLHPMPPAPLSPTGWQDLPYYEFWAARLGEFFDQHVNTVKFVRVPHASEAHPYENPPLWKVTGWRDAKETLLGNSSTNDNERAEWELDRGVVLTMQRHYAEAIDHFRFSIKLNPNDPLAYNELAWILATNPDDKLRNGAEAARLAERACELAEWKRAAFIGTLDAAYAEAGRFQEALSTAKKTIAIAERENERQLVELARQRIELYLAKRPYHTP